MKLHPYITITYVLMFSLSSVSYAQDKKNHSSVNTIFDKEVPIGKATEITNLTKDTITFENFSTNKNINEIVSYKNMTLLNCHLKKSPSLDYETVFFDNKKQRKISNYRDVICNYINVENK